MSRALSVYHGRFGRASLYNLDRAMTLHAHREGHLIIFLGGSSASCVVQEKPFALSPGIAVGINPWESHCFRPGAASGGGLFLVLYINPTWFRQVGGEALRFRSGRVELSPEIQRSVETIADILTARSTPPTFDRMLYDLTMLCQAQTARSGQAEAVPHGQASNGLDFRIGKSLQILGAGFASSIELDGVARHAGLSRPHFYKLFKQHVGVTPHVYVNTLRMERAVDMVAAPHRSITDIAGDLGFSCQSVFTRFFVSHVGMPPSDYRSVARVLAG
jgi:AraC-like DNA-binding protein